MTHPFLEMLRRLADASEALDRLGRYAEADAVLSVATKTAEKMERSAQYSGPWNLDIPIENRVIPWSEMDQEMTDMDAWRNKFPRYDNPRGDIYRPLSGNANENPNGEQESIFGMNGGDPAPGPAVVTQDSSSPSMMGGTEDFEWDQRRYTGPDSYKNNLPH